MMDSLEKSEQRFLTLLEEAPIGICNTDLKGKITYVNKRFEEVSGYSRQEVVGKNGLKLGIFSAGTLKLLVKRLNERLMGRPSRLLEMQFKCKDGHWIWVAIEGKLIRERGIPVGFQIIARDITERQQAEERERHLNLVLKALRDINQLITREKDRDRMIQKGCQVLVDTRGYERAWIALVDENRNPLSVVAAGLGKESPVFLKQMKSAKYPDCVKELWSQDSPFLGLDCPGAQHKGCILAEIHSRRGVYRCRLEYDGKVYGMLGVTIPSEMFADEKEKELFLELGGDLAFALKAIDEEEGRKKAEESLKNSEKFLDSVIENTPSAIWVSDAKGTIIRMNQALRDLLKIKDEEIIGKYNVLNDAQVIEQGFLPLIKSVFEKGETVSFTLNYDTAKEKQVELAEATRWVLEIVISAIKNEDGKVIHAICQEKDITEQGRAEEALHESEARYRAVIEGAHDMIQSVGLDGRIIFVNKFWLDTLGYTEAELPSLNLFEIIHPDSLAHCQELFAEVVGGKPVHGIEAVFLARDGRKILVEGNAAPRYIGDRVVATQGIFRDVTRRKQAEEALQAEKNKLQSIISAIEYGISIQDRDYNLLYQSQPSRIDGGYHLGEKCYRAYEGRDEVCDGCPMAKAFKDGKAHTSERKVVSSSGEVLFLENTANPMRDDKGKIVSCLEVIRDITERKQTEEELRLRAQLLDSATDSIFVHDLDENFVYVNEAACRLYGYSREELLKMKLHQLVPPEQANGLATLKQETLGKGEMVFETVNLRKDGSTVPLEVHSRTIESGGIKLILAIARDITERKKAEAALQAEKNKLQSVIGAMEYGLTIQDADYNILYQNEPLRKIFGDHLGEKCYRVYEGKDSLCDGCPVEKAFRDGKSHPSERKVVIPSGELTFWENTANPIRDAQGRIVSCLEVTRDITERKWAEEALRVSEEKYKNLVEATSDLIWEADEKGVYTFISPKVKDILGYEVDEVVGKKRTLDFLPREEARKWLKHFKEINAQRKSFFGFEITHLHKNGDTLVFEVSGIPFFDSGGEFKGFAGVDKDITERKRMQEQLVISDRLASVGELASGIAHELNNPLTGVIGFSQLVLDKTIPDDVREDVDMVYREAQRAAQVVKNLLTFARKHPPEKQMLNINKVIEKVLELRAYEQKVNNIRVDNRLAPDLPEAMADYFQLQQVFLNIIINAEYFMKEAHNGGTLTITTEKAGNNVRASFADDGSGIAEGSLGHLFDPFFTTKEVGKGTGLGLSICHGIVAEHGGRIYAASKPGKGATFTVELPIGGRRRGRGAG